MSENEGNANMDQGNEASPADVVFIFGIPEDTILPYVLPEANEVEEEFEPITSFAFRESGESGKLNESDLKELLTKLDRRFKGCKKITTVVQGYHPNIGVVAKQLLRIHRRSSEIALYEKYFAQFLKGRITELITAIEDNKEISQIVPIPLTSPAKKALEQVGRRGPLDKDALLRIIHDGIPFAMTEEQKEEVVEQLRYLIRTMKSKETIENEKFKNICEKITKAVTNIVKESTIRRT